MSGISYATFGIEETADATNAAKDGFYPALVSITIIGEGATPQPRVSQLTSRDYKKHRTRSASVPFGRRTSSPPSDATTGAALSNTDAVDYKDMEADLSEKIRDTTAAPSGSKVKSVSFEAEIWQPTAAALSWLSTLDNPGSITAF